MAVAKQVKGLLTMTAAVKEAINKCLPAGVKICVDVVKKLMECRKQFLENACLRHTQQCMLLKQTVTLPPML